MEQRDPVAEWRARWQAGAPALVAPPPQRRQSLWLVFLASFAGTSLALLGCFVLAIGGLWFVGSAIQEAAENPDSLTYRNDTAGEVWIYECIDRCEDFSDWFPMEPGEEGSFELEWYWAGRVDWIVVVNEDTTYGCIELPRWEDQMIVVSTYADCPADIHSPTGKRM
jgi:hypothetical protein